MSKKAGIPVFFYKLFTLFVISYTVCPVYFFIFGFAFRDLLIIFFSLICVVVLINNRFVITCPRTAKPLLVLLVLWAVINSLLQLSHGEYFYAAKNLLIWTVIVIISPQFIRTREQFIKLLDLLIYISLVIGIFGIIEEFTHFNVFDLLNTYDTELNYNAPRLGIFRIISFTSHAISYSIYCMFNLILTFYRLTVKKEKIFIASYIVLWANIIFAFSRGVIFIAIVSQFILLYLCGFTKFIKTVFATLLGLAVFIGIGSLLSSGFKNAVNAAWYVVLALFDDSYVSILKGMGFTDNTSGIGNRLDLYGWVVNQLKPDYFLGKGRNAVFSVTIRSSNYVTRKKSIEVEWLQTLFRYGFTGLIAEIVFYLKSLFFVKKKMRQKAAWEGKLSFTQAVFVLFIAYILIAFIVAFNNEQQLFSVIIILLISYIMHSGFVYEK